MNLDGMINDYKQMGKVNIRSDKTLDELLEKKERELQAKINKASKHLDNERYIKNLSRMPKKTIDLTLNDIKNTWENEEMPQVNKAIESVYDFKTLEKGLYIYSKQPGTGKTTLLSALARAIYKQYEEPIFFATEEYILSKVKESYNPEAQTSEDEVIKNIAKNRAVFIDELGQNSTDWAVRTLKRLLDEMLNNDSVLFITSNYGLNDLAAKLYSKENNSLNRTIDQFVDRLNGMTKPVKFGNKSYR
ncbi:MAG: AAA family ATPase [Anaerococcus sp.]|uniref:AAA family ATPase n=1 Tax=Anaerococcus sp. TaxID=1872515 RepID=UPI0029044A11|nr:AAA family ATPase [Anaerococcus sp.]MDU2565514.1 AAA family ATPase [Anaerococcus sp.]